MNRLTIRNDEGIGVLRKPYECERCGETCWSLPDLGNGSPTDRLAEYEELEDQGRLLKLPCAVGDTVWDIDFRRPCGYEVTGFSFGSLNDDDWEEEKILDQIVVYYTNSNGSITGSFAVGEIGKTVFLTREEAEAALNAPKGEINGKTDSM